MNSSLSSVPRQVLAAQELLRRRTVRKSLTEWSRHIGFDPAPHHRLIIAEIEALLAADDYDTLLIFAPPGSAKSSYVSIALPSWYLAQNPKESILAASHSLTLAAKWGRRVRNLVAEHGPTLGLALAHDSQAADRWATSEGGEYLAAGVGMGIAGFRAYLGIIDDPFGSREDAYSQRIRDKTWDWFIDDFSNRLKPNAKRVIMHTRWHLDDLAGRIIEAAKKGRYRIRQLVLPAIAEDNDPLGRRPGEYLWDDPKGYNYGALLRARREELKERPQEWAALFQQRPTAAEGAIFKAHWWKLWNPPDGRFPKPDYVIASADTAYTEKEQNDPTGFVVLGVWKDKDGLNKVMLMTAWRKRLEILGEDTMRRPHETFPDWVRRTQERWGLCEWIAYSCRRFGVHRLIIESKASGLSVAQAIRKLQMDEGWAISTVSPEGDKVARAYAVQQAFIDGLVYAPDRDWAEMVRDEMASFPLGAYKDLTDAMTQGLKYLRDRGRIIRREEHEADERELAAYRPPLQPLYPV